MMWKQAISFALTSCAALVLLMGLFVFGPAVETKFFPVYSKFEIVSVVPYGEGKTRAVFKFTKNRQCDPQGFAWYSGELGGAFRQLTVSIDAPGGGASRPLGLQESSPYIIDAPPDRVRNAVFAEIFNRCHFLWTTRSEIYP